MKVLLSSFFRVVFYSLICYTILAIATLPFILIPDSFYPNVLSSIIIKQSAFLIAGLIIILFSKYVSISTEIIFRVTHVIVYCFSTLFIVIIFASILNLLGITEFKTYRISSVFSFIKFLIYCTVPTFFIGFGEEFIFRWYLINRLGKLMNSTKVIVISSLIFCLGHNWNLPNMIFAFSGGCFFALIYIKTGSIFNSISIHAAWNFGQRFFFSGMNEFTYNAQRVLLFDVKNMDLYNWSESILGLFILVVFVFYYHMKLTKQNKYAIA